MSGPTFDARTVLTGRVTNWPIIWLSVVLLAPLLILGSQSKGEIWDASFVVPLGIVLLAGGVTLVTLSSLRTTVGPRGVTVHFGPFGWPQRRYPIRRIERATATRVSLTQWSWGLPWTRRDGLRLVLGSGPAIALRLDNGRKVLIGVPDAEAAVRVLGGAASE